MKILITIIVLVLGIVCFFFVGSREDEVVAVRENTKNSFNQEKSPTRMRVGL